MPPVKRLIRVSEAKVWLPIHNNHSDCNLAYMKGKVAAIEVAWSHFHLDCSCHRFIHGAAGQEQEIIILFQLQLALA